MNHDPLGAKGGETENVGSLSLKSKQQQINSNSPLLSVFMYSDLCKYINVSKNWDEMVSQKNVKILLFAATTAIFVSTVILAVMQKLNLHL